MAAPINKTTSKDLQSLARLMLQPPGALADLDFSRGLKSGGVPERYVSDDKDSLVMSGDDYRAFKKAFGRLSVEARTEHLTARELETQLWDLCCELFFEREKYSDDAKRTSRLHRFVAEVTREWEPFECAFSISGVRIDCRGLNVDRVQFVQWDDVPGDWRIKGCENIAEDMAGQCVAITTAKGGDVTQAVIRARASVDRALDALRLGVTQTIYLRVSDRELVFRRSEFELVRGLGEDNATRFNWSFRNRPIPTTIDTNRAKAIEDYLKPIVDPANGLPRKLADRIRLAARWIGASAVKPDVDDKVVGLCTAIEALLATKSDRKKGEIIAIRAMLLPSSIGEGFTDPYPLYALYNRRSDVIHGTKLGVCGDEDYRLLHFEATLILKHLLAVVDRHPTLSSFEDVVELIETPDALRSTEVYFGRYGKYAQDIVKVARERYELAVTRAGAGAR